MGPYWYLVESRREGKHVHQKHIRYIGTTPPVRQEEVKKELQDPNSELSTGLHIYKKEKEFVCFDLETTGFSNKDMIIEVGMQRFKINDDNTLEYLEDTSTYVNPGRPIPKQITDLTGITDDQVRDAPKIEEVMPGVARFIKGKYLVGHNAPFDCRFLNRELERMGEKPVPDEKVADTLNISRKMYGEKKNTLQDCADRERVIVRGKEDYHSATYDLKVTAEVFVSMMGKV